MEQKLDRLTVLGGGVLGSQIAWHSAYSGKTVAVYDVAEAGLDNCRAAHASYDQIYQEQLDATPDQMDATRARLSYSLDLDTSVADADIVIECVPEVPEIKTELYQKLAGVLPDKTILATNSSTFLPSQFADSTGRPDKYCALHFANLIWSLNVAEVMAHPGTSDETLIAATRFAIEIGMVPVPVRKEQNGYVMNTMLVALLNAAQTLVTNGVSDHETIDRTFMITNRGCERGPFGIIDVIGMKTIYDVFSYFYDVFSYWGNESGDEQMIANASYVKEHLLDNGLMGLQTGRGYYRYPDPAYSDLGFLDVPDVARTEEFAAPTFPQNSA